jgi:hypothetical protein
MSVTSGPRTGFSHSAVLLTDGRVLVFVGEGRLDQLRDTLSGRWPR